MAIAMAPKEKIVGYGVRKLVVPPAPITSRKTHGVQWMYSYLVGLGLAAHQAATKREDNGRGGSDGGREEAMADSGNPGPQNIDVTLLLLPPSADLPPTSVGGPAAVYFRRLPPPFRRGRGAPKARPFSKGPI